MNRPARWHSYIFQGFNSRVVAVHRDTGELIWQWKAPKGMGYVIVILDGDRLMASVLGFLYCLDPETGEQRWLNELRGLGTGVPSLVSVRSRAQGAGIHALDADFSASPFMIPRPEAAHPGNRLEPRPFLDRALRWAGCLAIVWLGPVLIVVLLGSHYNWLTHDRDPGSIWLAGLAVLAITTLFLAVVKVGAVSFRRYRVRIGELLLTVAAGAMAVGVTLRAGRAGLFGGWSPALDDLALLWAPLMVLMAIFGASWSWKLSWEHGITGTWARLGILLCGWLLVPGLATLLGLAFMTFAFLAISILTDNREALLLLIEPLAYLPFGLLAVPGLAVASLLGHRPRIAGLPPATLSPPDPAPDLERG